MTTRFVQFAGTILIFLLCGAGESALPQGAVQVPPGTEAWRTDQPGLPPGAKLAVLEGDPKAEGVFTIRLKVRAGTVLAPHWHPTDERVTVLEGQVRVGFGRSGEESSMRELPSGSFYLNPARVPHYISFPQDSTVQITGIGPWKLYPAKP